MPQLFISHATEDANFAQKIAASMRAAGADVWIAPSSIRPGEDFVDAIQRGLADTTHLIVLMSPQGIESSWVKLEMNTAIRLERSGKLAIMPILYQPCEPPMLWGSYHWAEYKDEYDSLIQKIVAWMGLAERRSWVRPRPLPEEELASLTDELVAIAREVDACTQCPLHQERLNPVAGDGPPNARIMFIGESPGPEDDQTGTAFVSAAGDFLMELMDLIDLPRSEVFLTNILKCRPNQNRDPKTSEMNACADYLQRQLDLINPRIVVTLGRFALMRLLPGAKISQVHGQPQPVDGRTLFPMYHPAAALYRARYRTILIDDFYKLRDFMDNPANFE